MIIIGIDPGKTIGLVVYDTRAGTVLQSEVLTDAVRAYKAIAAVDDRYSEVGIDVQIGIERPRIYQSAGNELCDTIEQTSWLMAMLCGMYPLQEVSPGVHSAGTRVYLLERRAVVGALSAAMGQQVRGDAGVWQALCALHPDAMRRPVAAKAATRQRPAVEAVEAGPLYGVTSHARQAAAVAWALARHLGEV